MPQEPALSTDLAGLDPAGLLRGALGDATASWPQDGPVAWSPPDAGEAAGLFPGYDDVRLIGRGGMGAVYAARQVSLERRVALKLLPAELSRNPAAAERFRREARALAKLAHPNIVAVHDFGETADGAFFFVMEHIEGADLHRLIRDGGIALPQVLDIVRQVCDALEYAHARGFVHRDIKPANILVDTAGRVKVSDFGLARLVGESPDAAHEPTPTMTGGIVGTPDYIAPEQRAGDRPVDHRADIYSLGVMLYEMLTGSVPRGAFEPPSRKADVDQQMDRVVLRAMQEEPDKRYQHAAEVKTDVDRAARRPALRWWLRAAALLVVALGAVAVWKWNAGAVPRPVVRPEASVRENALGMKFLPTGVPGVLMAHRETQRADFATYTEEEGLSPAASEIYYPADGIWLTAQGTWVAPPAIPPQQETHAAVAISADEAAAFCSWLTRRERTAGRLTGNEHYRLPTADEWAQAAGLPLQISTRKDPPRSPVTGSEGLTLQSKPDAAGFCDLHGNVAEWTSSPGDRTDELLFCGAGWADAPQSTPPSVAIARSCDRNLHGVVLGFRIVLDSTRSP